MSSSTTCPPPAPGLNVIALISGGKDSLYSILHCIRNGHNVVALANLYPNSSPEGTAGDDEEEEDIDSFMYQTIGHSVIPLYESALGIPLYRAPITGGAVDTSRIYRQNAADQMAEAGDGDGDGDETESLIPLLRRIKREHPEANAVSAGAILSTYQRTRIENVAGRLGLVPLAWLWMYSILPASEERKTSGAMVDEAGLLEDMAASGCEARIIKVASGGLDEGFLWEDVSGAGGAVRRRMLKGMRRFAGEEEIRGAVLGEGGEYESLALDGPGFLWKQKIEIGDVQVRRGDGGVGYMRLKGAKCVPKTTGQDVTAEAVRRPSLLDDSFAGALEGLVSSSMEDESTPATRVQSEQYAWKHEPSQSKCGNTWTISNITAPEAGPGTGEQMEEIANKTQAILESSVYESNSGPRSTDDIVFATVLLRSMTDFALMNSVYVSLFKKPNPPGRAAIACGDSLPDGVNIMVSFVVDLGPRDLRQGLHVQSRSYWAPANIGPYSQAMSIPLQGGGNMVYIAGQIPLEPASMEIAGAEKQSWVEGYALRSVLSLQHLWRIGTAMQVDWWLGVVAFMTGQDIDTKARLAWRLWEKMHIQPKDDEEEEESALDAWDIKCGGRGHEQLLNTAASTLPNFSIVQSDPSVPPFFAVQVEELPRGSDIEWQGLGCRCDQLKMTLGEIDQGCSTETTVNDGLRYTGIEIGIEQAGSNLETCLRQILDKYCQTPTASHAVVYTAQSLPGDLWPGQVVLCTSLWGQKGRKLVAGVIVQMKSPDGTA
ncbi:hypothetical protein ASPWEDRAFT_23020 [Aspergillus wentii DTO 134E9]|uniref:Diphthine--ammonia ligase n=1 Tax=Aspergillus wentii DTO 134E9 TaxID=1073089 RepID=A0A1L9S131_ASPWE|nr:uncharacterized protein ASPWEDRAFT_23020 [Aspergillus wentii DTO 134E9]KAI9931116.1 hypothetical protein MW887_010773 [Aspergillus wentii]OJJ40885.1 hypothetical protein ASPWEDRAFT_23020 [Aspergillus wentii DTO 134E9]